MNYDRQIVEILLQVSSHGIRVQALAKHVYNLNVNFFFQPSQEEVYRYVQGYIRRNSGGKNSLIEKVSHGCYRLNMQNNQEARQLNFIFLNEKKTVFDDDKQKQSPIDLSLDLFD